MVRYENARIYVLKRVKDGKIFYVGSTVVPLNERLYAHRMALTYETKQYIPLYQYINKIGGRDAFYIELYKKYPCDSKEELHRMEGRVMTRLRGKGINLKNIQQAGRTRAEYTRTPEYKAYQKEFQKTPKQKEYRKEYSKTPKYKEYRKKYMKEYTAKQFKCPCGVSVLHTAKARHLKTQKHINRMAELNDD